MLIRYIARRVLIFIPTLLAISLIAFVISLNAPGDPIENRLRGESVTRSGKSLEAAKDSLRAELGLNLPVFYITIGSFAEPDTLYRIGNKSERENLSRMISHLGNWPDIQNYYIALKAFQLEAAQKITPDSEMLAMHSMDSIRYNSDHFYQVVVSLLRTNDPGEIDQKLNYLLREYNRISGSGLNYLQHVVTTFANCRNSFELVKNNSTTWKTYVPWLNFYGYNQYHRWLFGDGNMFTGARSRYCKGVVRGDFGLSYVTWKPVTETIARALPWSLFFTVISVLLAYLISIPIGVYAASKRGSLFDRSSAVVLFMLYSLPTFLMGTILLMTFANPDHWNIFPANGVQPVVGFKPGIGFWEKFQLSWKYFVLPLICYTYSSLAFLSRTMRVAMLEINTQDYMRTARAKGLSPFKVYFKHGLRNALLPIITVFSNVFPIAVGGSVVLEYLFGIPGMGPEILIAQQSQDYQMIVAVFTLAGLMTLVGYLVADILYAIADPRISYSKR